MISLTVHHEEVDIFLPWLVGLELWIRYLQHFKELSLESLSHLGQIVPSFKGGTNMVVWGGSGPLLQPSGVTTVSDVWI